MLDITTATSMWVAKQLIPGGYHSVSLHDLCMTGAFITPVLHTAQYPVIPPRIECTSVIGSHLQNLVRSHTLVTLIVGFTAGFALIKVSYWPMLITTSLQHVCQDHQHIGFTSPVKQTICHQLCQDTDSPWTPLLDLSSRTRRYPRLGSAEWL